MQEFESISASSYDPSALAAKLTAKAAEGWSVVAIVPTGGDVTAFVSRDKSGATESPEATETIEAVKDEPVVTPEDAAASLALPDKSEPESKPDEVKPDPEPDAVTEPSGWAVAPEPATPETPKPAPEPTVAQPAVTIQPANTYEPAAAPGYQPAAAPVAAAPAAPDPAPAPAVPAGWYADPAGRFELRYWDGSTWTEHVSRAGQQFTDPPVA
ncbi:MAG: DUF2510 domain-containing protein [Ilumatobacteraceae bacterium]